MVTELNELSFDVLHTLIKVVKKVAENLFFIISLRLLGFVLYISYEFDNFFFSHCWCKTALEASRSC